MLAVEETRPKAAVVATRTRVLLYGNSLLLSGIGVGLQAEDRFEIVTLPRSLPGARDVEELAPDVIVFDVETPGTAAAFSALDSHSDLLILGVSSDRNIVRLWSSRQYRELSIKGLAALIESRSPPVVSPSDYTVITEDR